MEFNVQQGGNTNGAIDYPTYPFAPLLSTPTAADPSPLKARDNTTIQAQASQS